MKPTITLYRDRQFLIVSPVVDRLEGICTHCFVPEHDDRHGVKIVRENERLFAMSDYGDAIFLAGLASLVIAWLEENGYEIDDQRVALKRLPAPTPSRNPWIDDPDPHLLEFVRCQERGIIRYAPGDDPIIAKSSMIRQVLLAWPTKRLVVLCTHREEAARLANLLPDAEAVLARSLYEHQLKVVATTYRFARVGGVNLAQRNLVIAADLVDCFSFRPWVSKHPLYAGTEMGTPKNDWLYHLSEKVRLFGLLPMETQLNRQQQDVLLMLFGMKVLRIPKPGVLYRRVDFLEFQHVHRSSMSRNKNLLQT